MFQTSPGLLQEPEVNVVAEVANEYAAELSELTFNSKPIINNLTIIAGENLHAAEAIAGVIENRIQMVESEKKLPLLYLLDSICKNIRGVYVSLFARNIVHTFINTYSGASPAMRNSLTHLLKTWHSVFPPAALQAIEQFLQTVSAPRMSIPPLPPHPQMLHSAPMAPPAASFPSYPNTFGNVGMSEWADSRPAGGQGGLMLSPEQLHALSMLPNFAPPVPQNNFPGYFAPERGQPLQYGSFGYPQPVPTSVHSSASSFPQPRKTSKPPKGKAKETVKDKWATENLKRHNENAIKSLYFDFPLQCKNCGLRFVDRHKMDLHLDWHFVQNRREKEKSKKAMSRNWFLPREDWILDSDITERSAVPFPFGEVAPSVEAVEKKENSSVPADESQTRCPMCGEPFEQHWDSEQEEWMYKNTISVDGTIYHQKCFRESSVPKDIPVESISANGEEDEMPPLLDEEAPKADKQTDEEVPEADKQTNEKVPEADKQTNEKVPEADKRTDGELPETVKRSISADEDSVESQTAKKIRLEEG